MLPVNERGSSTQVVVVNSASKTAGTQKFLLRLRNDVLMTENKIY
jgi:hypothetical protein